MKRKLIQNFGKKLLLSLLAVSFLAVNESRAQTAVNLGLTLGANYGNLNSNVGSWSGNVGYQAAGSVEFRLSNHMAFAAEGEYISLTTNSNYNDSIYYYSKTLRINYNTQLAISFLKGTVFFKYYIPLGTKPITPYDNPNGSGNYFTVFAGPYISSVQSPSNTGHIKLTSHYVDTTQHDVVKDSTLTAGSTNTTNTAYGLATSVYGVTLGAGLNLKLSRGLELTFDLRYSRDLVTLDQSYTDKNGINYGFLGERVIIVNGTTGEIHYNAANAYSSFICFNVGLNIKLFEFGG